MATSVEYATTDIDPQYDYPDPSSIDLHHNGTNHYLSQQSDDGSKKRKNPPGKTSSKPDKKIRKPGPQSDSKSVATPDNAEAGGESSKPKRVRTGCLTCRERHLKCDEAWPNCANCRKSNRQCKRGVKLNFIDTWVDRPPHIVTAFGTERWKVDFLDESRDIASEYTGSTHKYPPLEQESSIRVREDQQQQQQQQQLMNFNMGDTMHAVGSDPRQSISFQPQQQQQQQLPPPPPPPPQQQQQEAFAAMQYQQQQGGIDQMHHNNSTNNNNGNNNIFDGSVVTAPQMAQTLPFFSTHASVTAPGSASSVQSAAFAPAVTMQEAGMQQNTTQSVTMLDIGEKRDFLNTAEETLFMQVFVEEVGLWMDSMDPLKHFSRLLPFHALGEPMLLNAFLACGAKHLTLVNPAYSEEKALNHYDTATRYLLKNLQNPNRDTVICATTAVILNVYEIMSERPTQRMNHIAGARALIKECGWTARASGIGAACFWLNVGLEVMSCLHFNWQVAWDPDDWGIDMTLSRELHNGMEESWTHKMLYIIGKVCNLRATAPRDVLPDAAAQQARLQQRYNDWNRLKSMAEAWNDCIPRTMHPIAYVYPMNTASKSQFPEIWLIKRTTIVARLFYHTAMLLLSQINPYLRVHENKEMADMQQQHSQMTCGIVAHVKDRGVASVAIRSLAHAAEVLTDRRQQEEVIEIFQKINKETGWRIGFVYSELKDKWGWNEGLLPHQYAQTHEAAARAKEIQENQPQQHAQAANLHISPQSYDFSGNNQQQQQQHAANTSMLHLTSPAQSLNSNASPPAPKPVVSTATTGRPRLPSGIPNPLYAKADFTLPQHPYQSYYVAPTAGYGNATNANNAWWTG